MIRLAGKPPKKSPVELRDAAFWKKRAKENNDALGEALNTLAQVSGLMERPPAPPAWALPRAGRKGRAAGLLHISDLHNGEVVKPSEILGLNAYNISIARRRFRQLIAATCAILPRWSADSKLDGMVVALNGDLVSGDIHDELRRTNEVETGEQVDFTIDECAAGFEVLAHEFGKLDVYVTCGNHGRTTLKSHAKHTAALNYDTLIGKQLARHFARDSRVTIHVAPSRDCEYTILGQRVLQTHGDQGGGGGQGFAGPVLPVARKAKAIEFMSAQTRDFYDIILTAHHHFSTHPTRKVFGNGSVVGYGEFARSIRAAPEAPMQWLMLVTERWGVREHAEIVLDKLGGWK